MKTEIETLKRIIPLRSSLPEYGVEKIKANPEEKRLEEKYEEAKKLNEKYKNEVKLMRTTGRNVDLMTSLAGGFSHSATQHCRDCSAT